MSDNHTRDHSALLSKFAQEYSQYSPASAAINQRALKSLVDGGSHATRLIKPFPPRIVSAHGAYVIDADGHQVLDFWQGHYANILGHNPSQIVEAITDGLQHGVGLQTGFTDQLQVEVAEIITSQTKTDKVRFTTSGTLATMYAIMLARAYTGRSLTMKVGGGWHGAHLWGLKGVGYQVGFEKVDSMGIPDRVTDNVVITKYNQPELLEAQFKQLGDQMACFILEPVIGAGGLMPASQEYISTARKLCDQYGVVLILDEVISAFRYHAGTAADLYGIQPDLLTLGKIIGGGMPLSAIAGKREIMALVGRESGRKVSVQGGSFSGHPASLVAAKTMLNYLVQYEKEIYPRLSQMAALIRETVLQAFSEEGILAQFSGISNPVIGDNSLHMLCFPFKAGSDLSTPDEVKNPNICDVQLSEVILQLAMLLEDVYIVHGLGCNILAHGENEISILGDASRRAAQRIKPYL